MNGKWESFFLAFGFCLRMFNKVWGKGICIVNIRTMKLFPSGRFPYEKVAHYSAVAFLILTFHKLSCPNFSYPVMFNGAKQAGEENKKKINFYIENTFIFQKKIQEFLIDAKREDQHLFFLPNSLLYCLPLLLARTI